jgi:hypothetical protein
MSAAIGLLMLPAGAALVLAAVLHRADRRASARR